MASKGNQAREREPTALTKYELNDRSQEHTGLLRKLREQVRLWVRNALTEKLHANARQRESQRHAASLRDAGRELSTTRVLLEGNEHLLPSAAEYKKELDRFAKTQEALNQALEQIAKLQKREKDLEQRHEGQDRLVGVLRNQLTQRDQALELARSATRHERERKDYYRQEWLDTRTVAKERLRRNEDLQRNLRDHRATIRGHEVAHKAIAKQLDFETGRATMLEGSQIAMGEIQQDATAEMRLSREEGLRAADPETQKKLRARWAQRDLARADRARHALEAPSVTPARLLGRSERSGSQEVLLPVFENTKASFDETRLVRPPRELRDTAKIERGRDDSDTGRGR